MACDAIWRSVVLGRYAIQERRYRDAVAELEPITAEPITSGPIAAGSGQIDRARLRYRAEVLLAWARACLGHPIDLIADGIDRAEMVRPDDTDDGAIRGIELVVAGQVSIRRFGITAVLAQLSGLPAAVAVPLTATGALAFRGSLRATMGLTRAASDDLTEATRRIEDSTDFGAGSFHAQLGFVQWLSGDWGRAALTSRKALDLAGTVVHQLTAAIAPLVDSGAGRFAEADDLIESARELLTESPWEPACLQFVNTLLVRAHAGGSAAEQATALAELRGTPFEITDISRAGPALLLTYIPALIWAKRLDEAHAAIGRLTRAEPAADWAPAVASWFRGLIHEARGEGPQALTALTAAVAMDLDLPLYRAHLLADHARLARLLGQHREAGDSLRQAESIYDRLGAAPFVERIRVILSEPAPPVQALAGGVVLTDREHDVLTLLLSGMSYAQIARELFITQSTVGYHLGNIYGKAGVKSRHELSDMARENPRLFGITVARA